MTVCGRHTDRKKHKQHVPFFMLAVTMFKQSAPQSFSVSVACDFFFFFFGGGGGGSKSVSVA